MKDYKKLDKSENYDRDAVEELAEAINEAVTLKARLDYLKDLFDENEELQGHIWKTARGEAIALHKIDDSHLTNIMRNLVRHDMPISREISSEARRRTIAVPNGSAYMLPEFVDFLDVNLDEETLDD